MLEKRNAGITDNDTPARMRYNNVDLYEKLSRIGLK
jgi:hypothetical protein